MKPSLRTLLICSCLLAAQRPAEAQVDLLSTGVGIFDVIRGPRSLLYQVEYKSGWNFYNLRWMAGLMGTGQGTIYAYTGAAYDIFLTNYLVLTPSFAPGIYFHGGGKRLGCPLEFRSCLEFAYRFACQVRLGTQLYHISNASIGHKNPGVEAITLFFAFPIP